jgi:hypothetical protein
MSLSAVNNHNPPECQYESTVRVYPTIDYPRHTRNLVEICMAPDCSDGRRDFTSYQFYIPMIFDKTEGDARIALEGITVKVLSTRVLSGDPSQYAEPGSGVRTDVIDYDMVDSVSLAEMLAAEVHPFIATSAIVVAPNEGETLAFMPDTFAEEALDTLMGLTVCAK